MTTNWQFDKAFLEAAIAKGERMLKDERLSRTKKQCIRYDIATFKRFLTGEFEYNDTTTFRTPKDIEKLKEYVLRKMQKQYKLLGENLINWIISLSDEEIFKMQEFSPTTNLSIDEQADLTIKTYEEHSKLFLPTVKKIIKDDTIKQIQCVEGLDTSYCHHDDITGLPYIIIDPHQASWTLCHETEHAIEGFLGLPRHNLNLELGSQLFEMLHTEELYKQQGFVTYGDFQDRVDDTNYFLTSLSEYFKTMKAFAELNFNVPTDLFLETIISNHTLIPDEVIPFIKEEYATDEQIDNMNYLFSYLSAIDAREKTLNTHEDASTMLEPYFTRRFVFKYPQDGFKPYKRYVEEMHQKVKTKKQD